MSHSRPTPGGPTTDEEFQRNLRWLLGAAYANGVNVTGGWMDRTESTDRPDWGIEIYEVTKSSDVVDI